MSRIHLLSEDIYNKISAGEVVERPASVLKELLENALDAGARRIAVRIEKAGKALISVTDDGSGMDPDDAILAFEPHATSKIATSSDLDNISSFGFRGEALPSIASVSKVLLRTRIRGKEEGTELEIHGGKVLKEAPCGCAVGTSFVVRDLFFNTPARRKFLRSAATEEKHIAEVITAIALANFPVAFSVTMDGRKFLESSASSDPSMRIRELFGKEYEGNLLPLSFTGNGITVNGYIAKRFFTKSTRQEQRSFVNGRAVESPAIYRGIREGFGPMLDKGRYPPAILFLSLPSEKVDVNVHPAKREVRFASDFEVAEAVRNAVAATLRQNERFTMGFQQMGDDELPAASSFTPSPSISSPLLPPEEKKEERLPFSSSGVAEREYNSDGKKTFFREEVISSSPPVSFRREMGNSPPPEEISPSIPAIPSGEMSEERLLIENILSTALVNHSVLAMPRPAGKEESLPGLEEEFPSVIKKQEEPEKKHPIFRWIGVLANSYILAENQEGLVVIDQHAAHERVLFEKLLQQALENTPSQTLLLPVTLELSRGELAFLAGNGESIRKLGFEVEPFGMNTVKLSGIPASLNTKDAPHLFREMIALASESGDFRGDPHRSILDKFAMAACKAAVKAHDALTPEEIHALVRQLSCCEQPFACPHGRPTVLPITLKELERRFGRR